MQSAVSELMIADLRLDAGGFCRPLDHTLDRAACRGSSRGGELRLWGRVDSQGKIGRRYGHLIFRFSKLG